MKNTQQRLAQARRAVAIAVAAMSALLLFAVPAFAASSALSGYSTPGAKIQTVVDGPAKHAVVHASTGPQLPFTGLDVVAVLAVGTVLLALGFAIRKLSKVAS